MREESPRTLQAQRGTVASAVCLIHPRVILPALLALNLSKGLPRAQPRGAQPIEDSDPVGKGAGYTPTCSPGPRNPIRGLRLQTRGFFRAWRRSGSGSSSLLKEPLSLSF